MDWRAKTGRVIAGVELRVVAEDGTVLPNDGTVGRGVRGARAVGHRRLLRRPVARPVPRRVAAHRRRGEPRRPRLHADLGPHQGRHQVRGGVDLVGRARERGHGPPATCFEAAVIGVPDERWDERPLVVVVAGRGDASRAAPRSSSSCPAGWPGGGCPSGGRSPTRSPRPSVGKFDKKVLRAQAADGALEIHEVDLPTLRPAGGRDG